MAEGLTNGVVARRLYVSPHTLNTHLPHVFAKLGVSNRVALAAKFVQAVAGSDSSLVCCPGLYMVTAAV